MSTSVAAKGAGTRTPPALGTRAVERLTDDAPIVVRIAAVMADCRMVEKSATNEQQGYTFAPEGEIVEMLRQLMAAAGIVLHADLEQVERYAVQFKNSQGSGVTVHVRYTLTGPLDSMPSCSWQGDATDNADKALPKALTAAKKSFLVHTFLLSTGSDPDAGGELSAPARRPPPQPPAPDKLASPAQVRRAFAIAANGDPIIPQDYVRLLAHLLTRTHADRVGKSIHALTMGEIRGVFDALEDYRSGPERQAYWDERLGKMAAFLEGQSAPPLDEPPSVVELPDDEPDPFRAESDVDIPF